MKILRIFGKRGCVKCDFNTSFAARRTSSECAVSSVVEHLPDTEGVTGSNPVSRTILFYKDLSPNKWDTVL